MDTASPQPGHLVLPLSSAQSADETSPQANLPVDALPQSLVQDLWLTAEAGSCDLTVEEFGEALGSVVGKFNCGLPPDASPSSSERVSFVRGLRHADLALATACALGREAAWERFVDLYQTPLTQAAIAMTGSATLGNELADSLYAELYGLRTTGEPGEEKRRCPLSSYSGRGSLLGWLRTTLAQRHVDHHRATRRETPLESFDAPAAEQPPQPVPEELANLTGAVTSTLATLGAEDRFLLSAYFLDRQTLLQIARTLGVHEATISRRIKRLTGDLRENLLQNLQSGGLSKRAAQEALGTDPRDLEINLRALLQTSNGPPFFNQQSTTKQDVQPSNEEAASTEAGQP